MKIRSEENADQRAVFKLNVAAFGSPAEAELVELLRKQADPVVSLVAEVKGMIVGHIMFSPVALSDAPNLKMMGLAPMAVEPEFQRMGYGSALVDAGLGRCRELEVAGVVVLGHPKFYPRFGFKPSVQYGVCSEYKVPEEMFMAMELHAGAFSGKSGCVKYHDAFGTL